MPARQRLAAALLAAAFPMMLPAGAQNAAKKPAREIYELRTYVLDAAGDHALIGTYLEKALIPALRRLGAGPVGVFTELPPAKPPKIPRPPMLHVLIPYPELATWLSQGRKLRADEAYQEAAKPYLDTPKTKPAYVRIKTRLLRAFAGWPKVHAGDTASDRIFEMRTYDSYSETKHALKVEMFNKHELNIFANVGFHRVFYGQALAGEDLPSLTYMLRFRNMDEHDVLWNKFRTDPAWLELKARKRYAATVSRIESVFLAPTAYSEI